MAFQISIRQAVRHGSRVFSPFLGSSAGSLDPGDQSRHVKERGERMQFYSSAVPADYEKRNYAKDVNQYTNVLYNMNNTNRAFLLRDVYEDMILDGIQPLADTFIPLLVGCMKGSRLQDAFYFYDEMKCMGYIPDDFIFNCLIATCGRCRQQRRAFQLLEEMKDFGVYLKLKTLTALLGGCGYAGLPKEASQVVQKIMEAALSPNKYCYAALIAAEKNKAGDKSDAIDRIMEILEQSRMWTRMDAFETRIEVVDEVDEYVLCLPTVDFVRGRPNMVDRRLTAFHAALCACADLKSTTALRRVVNALRQDGFQPDVFCVAQILRCHVACQEYDIATKALSGYLNSGRAVRPELFYVLIMEAMNGWTAQGMDYAKKLLLEVLNMQSPMTNKMYGNMLEKASQEFGGDYSVANLVFDTIQKLRIPVPRRTVDNYLRGLKRRQIPEGDSRVLQVTEHLARRPLPRRQLEAA